MGAGPQPRPKVEAAENKISKISFMSGKSLRKSPGGAAIVVEPDLEPRPTCQQNVNNLSTKCQQFVNNC